MRELAVRLLLVVVSSAGTLLFAEGALRLHAAATAAGSLDDQLEASRRSGLEAAGESRFSLRGLVQPSPHPDVVYELKPGLHGTFRGRRLATNSHGMRDCEHTVAKPAATFRIAVLGDSVAFGWGVDQEASYPEVLERRLDAAGTGRRFEVLNFAVPGYNTAMEVATFEHKALAFEPDLVILHFIDNDLRLPHFMRTTPDVLSWRRSFLLDRVFSRQRGPDAGLRHGVGELPRAERREVRGRYRHMTGDAGFRRAAARLAELARERSLPVVVVRLSDRHEHHLLVDEVIAAHGFHSVLAGAYFLAYRRGGGRAPAAHARKETFRVSERDAHPNAIGHELYAAALHDELVELGIADR